MQLNLGANTKRKIFLLLLISFLIIFFYLVRRSLFPFTLAAILAYAFNPLVEKIESFKINRVYAILLAYLGVFGLLLIGCYFGFPVIIRQLNSLGDKIPTYTSQVQQILNSFYENYQNFIIPQSLRETIDQNLINFQNTIIAFLSSLVSGIFNLFSSLLSFIIAPVLAFYLLKDKDEICQVLVKAIPLSCRSEILKLWGEIDAVLTSFIKGHLTVAVLVGALTAVTLALIGMDYPLLLGIIAGITNIIPYFGPIIGSIPAVLLALLKSQKLAFYVIIAMIIIQQAESNLISPRVLGKSVGLHPLLVIFVLLAGGQLWGLVGMLIAVPLTAVLKIIISYVVSKLLIN